jgi:radical SAM protein with 4Fe4S-binding SPASM domain
MKDLELIQVVWEATYRCPSHCMFCYNCWKNEYKSDTEMDLSQLKIILGKLPDFKRFVISGGEPLLRNDLKEIMVKVKEYTDNVSILTSGILIDDERARLFKKYDIFVQIPFHGLERTHNDLTGVKDGYKRAIKGVAFLRKHNVRFATSTVATKKNVNELKQVFKLGVALGASELQVIRFMPGGEGMKNVELMLNKEEYELMLEDLNSICSRYRIPGAIGAPNLPCKFPEDRYKHITMGSCSAGIDWLVIDPSGRVRICNHSPTILGSLIAQEFEEVWEHPILRAFRSLEVIPKECNGCKKRKECRGGCRAVAETYYGSLYAPDTLYG